MHPYVWYVCGFSSLVDTDVPQAAFMDLPLFNILGRHRLYGGIPHGSLNSGYWIKMALEAFPWILGGSFCRPKDSPVGEV